MSPLRSRTYAALRSAGSRIPGCVAELRALGFDLQREEDITANVLLSCDETASTHARAFSEANDRAVMDAFLGVPSSRTYREMTCGVQRYVLFRLEKPSRSR